MYIYPYTLTADDADAVNRRRVIPGSLRRYDDSIGGDVVIDPGKVVHVGNEVSEGDTFPMIVVKVWPNDLVNGQVMLDGSDTLWVTSVKVDTSND